MGIIGKIASAVIRPAADAFTSRNDRKLAERTLEAKIAEKKLDTEAQVILNQQEWELLSKWAEESTWKDEYVTVSVVSIFNTIVIGGIAAAFGYPQVLEGITIAIDALNQALADPTTGQSTPLGTIMTWTILAAIGVYGATKLRGR